MKFLFRSTDGHASSQPQAIGFFSSWTLPKRSISFLGLFFWRRSGMLALGLDGGNGFPSCSPWPALESWSTNLLARLFDTPRGSVRATLYLWCSSRSPSMCSTPWSDMPSRATSRGISLHGTWLLASLYMLLTWWSSVTLMPMTSQRCTRSYTFLGLCQGFKQTLPSVPSQAIEVSNAFMCPMPPFPITYVGLPLLI